MIIEEYKVNSFLSKLVTKSKFKPSGNFFKRILGSTIIVANIGTDPIPKSSTKVAINNNRNNIVKFSLSL